VEREVHDAAAAAAVQEPIESQGLVPSSLSPLGLTSSTSPEGGVPGKGGATFFPFFVYFFLTPRKLNPAQPCGDGAAAAPHASHSADLSRLSATFREMSLVFFAGEAHRR